MREAGEPSTGHVTVSRRCARPPGLIWSHHPRTRATQRGRKAKAALGGGPSTKRGQGQYKGRSPNAPACGCQGPAGAEGGGPSRAMDNRI
jgi:hypothetical protein